MIKLCGNIFGCQISFIKINFKEYKIEIDTNYYFLGYQHDKGTFYKTELETESFEINKHKLFMRRFRFQ